MCAHACVHANPRAPHVAAGRARACDLTCPGEYNCASVCVNYGVASISRLHKIIGLFDRM